MDIVDSVEQNLRDIFGEEEADDYRRERRRTESFGSDDTLRESDNSSEAESSSSSVSSTPGEEDNLDLWEENFNPTSLPLTGTPGLKIPGAQHMGPMDYFKLFFSISFLTALADATNAHARAILESVSFGPESRLRRWKETNADELLIFLGILFFMGNVRINNICQYWAKHHLVKFNLGKYMSRNRFQIIMRMLYFNNVANVSRYSQVEPLIKNFNNLMKEIVYPEKELTIDESMVLFRGRLLIRQYIKNKKNKFGVKLYVLADPNGLVYRLHMYKGSADVEVSGRGHVEKVVLKLLNDYLNAGHHVYMDNFYNSVGLAETLLSKRTYCTGTLLKNRKRNPTVVISKKLKRGESIHRSNRAGVCVLNWKDKRNVLTLSTEHTPEMREVLNRRGRIVKKPNIVIKYNQFMKGVDRHDQMLSYYPCEHKTLRWYKKIGIHIFQTMFLNAYLLYKKGTGNNITLKSFREDILNGLLPPPAPPVPPQVPMHMPKELPRNGNGVVMRRKCFRCWNVFKKRKDCNMYCRDCDKGLCLQCYEPYHQSF